MQAENWKKVKELLDEVLQIETSERRNYLKNSGVKAEIRAEVESLLAFESESEDLMRFSAVEFSKDFFDGDENSLVGQEIGVYKIVGELGQGGMGAVYLAERSDGKFKQKVALKLLKREMNTVALRRRFQQEREILASLEHPNIARLLDAGTTGDKIPFLAMEYVEGLPIDDYCSINNLDLNSRLDLFRKVCSTVNFAHRNLIVHRDLKPSNILVNDEGTPKLLDFGISKILSPEFEQLNSATVTKLGVMTPGYASPEQLQGKSVTTATDIYSLGVILYELLSGHRPFESKESDLKEIYKAVLETEPLPPSAMISDYGFGIVDLNSQPELPPNRTKNQHRQTNPKSQILNPKSLSGDLDNIVLKSLRKEPERRYSSAENLAEDIHRHQRGLPVTARPNTFAYRAEKFFKRNRVGVIAGVLLLFAIIGGIAATLWQARVARTERDRARLEARKAEKINLFLQNVLNLSNPFLISSANPDSNLNATVAQALDEAAQKVETDLAGQPEIQAEIHYTLGKTYMAQGQFEKAKVQLEKALEKFSRSSSEDSSKKMQVKLILGGLTDFEGTEADTEPIFAESVAYFRENLSKDEENVKWLTIALGDLSGSLLRKGKNVEAENLLREGLQYSLTLEGQDSWFRINSRGDLGDFLVEQGKLDEAIQLYKANIEEGNKISNKPRPEIANSYYDLGRVFKRLENYAEAQENIQQAYQIYKTTLGEETVQTAMTRKQIAELYYFQGDYQKARAEIDEVLKVIRKVVPEKPNLYENYAENVLANILTKTGEAEKSEKIMREVVASYPKLLESPNADIATAKRSLGETLIAQRKFDEAKQILTESEKEFVETVGEDAPQTKKCREILASIKNQ
jgi:eukaryotic-like serine/threonine-protein kinase